MPYEEIIIGTPPLGDDGDDLPTGFTKARAMFQELYNLTGEPGEPGVGVPAGGITNQVLEKASNDNYDTQWTTLAASVIEKVAGGSGFIDVSGDVVFDLSTGRTFFVRVVGNITSWGFTNIPSLVSQSPNVRIVFLIDATGGYVISSGPTVTFRDGSTLADINTAADAENELVLWTVGSEWRGAFVWNGTLALDPIILSFAVDGSQLAVFDRAMTVDLGSVTNVEADSTAGTGTLSYKKNGSTVSGVTAFAVGDVLEVTMASSTTPSA
ncbi:MAG: hypothetical protein LC687_02030, partial [Actinobacteria bacterium]|nr:hypothetical protein [Actinomycetota bacterium]